MTAKALIRKGFEAPKSTVKRIAQGALLAVATAGVSGMAMAADAKPVLNSGDTAWTMVSAALVLLMTIPGLAIFYGGLTRAKNMLSVLAQCTVITAAVSIVWVVAGYSLAFAPGTPFIGGLSKAFMAGIGINTLNNTIPEMAFALFQMTFAIITPALIIGAFAERMKFSALLLFSVLWSLAVYSPIAHMVWGPGGWLAGKGVLDFAGGTVVHIAAGISALVAALVIGKRLGYGKTAMPPNNLAMTMIGAAMLWVGWFGFNGGSELAADGRAAMALMVTQVATAAAVLAWMALEWWIGGKPSLLGMVSGAVAGLVAITPASGFVGPMGAIAIGIAAGAVCYWMVTVAKHKLGYDDTLDAFGIHGAGGVVGAILTGVFAVKGIGGTAGALEGNIGQIWVQTQGVLVTLVYAGIGTFILLKLVDLMVGLRVSEEEEYTGLDLSQHGERLVVDTEGLRIFEPASMSGHAGAPTPDAVILGKPKPGH